MSERGTLGRVRVNFIHDTRYFQFHIFEDNAARSAVYRNHSRLSSSASVLYFTYEEISVLYCVSLYKITFGIDTIEIFVSYL